MKKIMFYINAIHHGGAERVMCNLASRLSKNGYTCILVTSFIDSWEYSYDEKVKRISLFEKPLEMGVLKKNIVLVKALRNLLKLEKPDVLISFMAEPNFRAVLSSIGLKNKVIVSVRNDPNKEYPNILYKALAKTLYTLADGIVFQTEEAKKWFPSIIQNKSKIIFNQVDEVFYNCAYDGERHDVVTTGRLTEQKNHKLLIQAFAKIADKVLDNLIIYGEGELREELENLISDLHMRERIFLPGSIKDVAMTIRTAKLFVLSSDYEGMPNSLMEAMALGIPCISTDCPCGGPRMLFGNYLLNNMVPCGNVDALSKCIETNLLNSEKGIIEKKLAIKFQPEVVYHEWKKYIVKIIDS